MVRIDVRAATIIRLILIFTMSLFFFFNDTATTEIYTLSLHDALPISPRLPDTSLHVSGFALLWQRREPRNRSEEHTSELQSLTNLVCRLLLEKKNTRCCCSSVHNVFRLSSWLYWIFESKLL